jgi:anti-anti-sigma factor
MEVTSEKNDTRLVLRAIGRFDAAGAKVVADALEQALAGGSHTVDLDMAGVDYLSSAGIRVLVTYYKKFSQLKGCLYLTSVSERICQLLEMTGLYGLLDRPDEQEAGTGTGLQTVRSDGWELASHVLEADGSLVLRVIGQPVTAMTGPEDESSPEVLAFSPTTLAFGTGALGYDAAECKGRYGPFLAAGGYAAFRPREGDRDPDFEEYAEAYIPKLHALSAVALAGNYSLQFTFESTVSPPGLYDMARALLAAGGVTAAGFVLAAECEVPEGSVPSPGSRDAPARVETPAGLTSADGSRLCLVFIGGVVGEPGSLPVLPVPAGTGTDPVVYAHAAFFSYQPLRRHGRVKLKDTAELLFDRELLDVLCLAAPGCETGSSGIRLLRGLAWSAPLQP